MNLIVSGRGVDLDERLKSYAAEKLTKVQRFFDRILKIEVEFAQERNPRVENSHRVKVTVSTPLDLHRAHGEGADHYAAVDAAAHRLEVQFRRMKDRLTDHHHHRHGAGNSSAPPVEPADEVPTFVAVPQQIVKPLMPDEARMELESRGLSFMLFTNAETMKPTVLYHRGDDAYGLIEHEG